MKYRKKMSRRYNKKNFRKGSRVHRKNGIGRPMRGGIRL
jgi:hypothetical protein